ncbi:MAG: L,D-transpeptidase family protein [Pyrinomonadaceae bacterium]
MKTFLISLSATLLFLTGLFWIFGQTGETLQKMKNPLIVIKKKERTLELFDGGRLVKTYKIALGFAPEGDKQREGDGKTPEGEFYIFTKNDKSKFYLSLGLSYPNVEDATRGLQNELISQAEYDSIVKAISEKRSRCRIQNSAAKSTSTATEAKAIGQKAVLRSQMKK